MRPLDNLLAWLTSRWACLCTLVALALILFGCRDQPTFVLTLEQKLEDFWYLYRFIIDNYPYLNLLSRSEGYNWPAHRAEEVVRAAVTDEEFAKAINRMVLSQ